MAYVPTAPLDPYLVRMDDLAEVLRPFRDAWERRHTHNIDPWQHMQMVQDGRRRRGETWSNGGFCDALQAWTGVPGRRIRQIFAGHMIRRDGGRTEHVTLQMADRILTGLGRPDLLYQLEVIPRWPNVEKVRQALDAHPGATSRELADETGLSRDVVYNSLMRLRAVGVGPSNHGRRYWSADDAPEQQAA